MTDELDTVVLGAMFFGTTFDEPTSFALLDRYVDAGGVWIEELGVTRSEVVLSWMVGGMPPVRPILGVSTPAQLDLALGAARRPLPAQLRARLDDAW